MSEQGIVKWYSIAKGYGFIRRQRSGESTPGESAAAEGSDVFVHYSDIPVDALNEGQRVCFEVVASPKGLKAQNVVLGADC